MAQIIKHRRGTLAELNGVTLANGELGIVTSSVASIGDAVLKTALVVGNTDGTNRLSIGRIIQGNATPNLSGITGGSAFNDMLYHETDAKALKVLNTGGNTTLDLGANISVSEIAGNISGSATSTGSFGYLNVVGDGVIGGNLTFGDANTDYVSFGADISSSLIPNDDDAFDLGSASQAWQDLYLEGDVHLTDAGTIQTDAGALTIDGAGGINIGTSADQAIDVDSSTFDLDASGALNIDSATSINLGTTADVAWDVDTAALDIDSSGAITIDGTSTVSIDGADDMNFTITSGTGGEDLTIQQIGANDSSIIITAAGTGTDAVSIDATAGDMLIAPNLINGKTLKIGPSSATQMVFTPHGTAASEKISLINSAGTADDAIKIDAEAGGLTLAAGNDSLHIDADGTDADALNIDSAGGIDVDAAAAVDILAASTVSVKGATGASFGDDTGTWEFDGGGALSETGMTTFSLTPSSTMDIDAGGAVTIDGTSVTIGADDSGVAISIGHTTSETTVNDNLTVTGNLTVNGTQTTVSSSVLDIGDNIIQVNGTPVTYGGIQVKDVTAGQTGSMVWNSTSDYWVAGLSGSEYRVPLQNTTTALTDNRVVLAQGNGRIESSANITDDGSTVDFNDVDLTSLDKLEGVDANTYIDLGGSTLIVTKGTLQPSAHDGNDLGATGTRYKDLWLQGNADLEGDIDVNGTANLDVTDIDGTLDVAGVTDFQARVDAQASLVVTGSVYATAGASVAASSASLVSFRNDSNDQLGYLASADTQAVTTGLVGYNTSTGNLTISSVIDGGSF
jgi:hypothetical protein